MLRSRPARDPCRPCLHRRRRRPKAPGSGSTPSSLPLRGAGRRRRLPHARARKRATRLLETRSAGGPALRRVAPARQASRIAVPWPTTGTAERAVGRRPHADAGEAAHAAFRDPRHHPRRRRPGPRCELRRHDPPRAATSASTRISPGRPLHVPDPVPLAARHRRATPSARTTCARGRLIREPIVDPARARRAR